MVKLLVLVTLSVFLSCVAAGGANPSPIRNLRSVAAAEAQSYKAATAGAWTKHLGNAMESHARPKKVDTNPTSGMEARVGANTMRSQARLKSEDRTPISMEAHAKTMNAPHQAMPNVVMESRKKGKHMMEAHMQNLAAQRAKLEALGTTHNMEAQGKTRHTSFGDLNSGSVMTP